MVGPYAFLLLLGGLHTVMSMPVFGNREISSLLDRSQVQDCLSQELSVTNDLLFEIRPDCLRILRHDSNSYMQKRHEATTVSSDGDRDVDLFRQHMTMEDLAGLMANKPSAAELALAGTHSPQLPTVAAS